LSSCHHRNCRQSYRQAHKHGRQQHEQPALLLLRWCLAHRQPPCLQLLPLLRLAHC
jgi:hypothetical protein